MIRNNNKSYLNFKLNNTNYNKELNKILLELDYNKLDNAIYIDNIKHCSLYTDYTKYINELKKDIILFRKYINSYINNHIEMVTPSSLYSETRKMIILNCSDEKLRSYLNCQTQNPCMSYYDIDCEYNKKNFNIKCSINNYKLLIENYYGFKLDWYIYADHINYINNVENYNINFPYINKSKYKPNTFMLMREKIIETYCNEDFETELEYYLLRQIVDH